SEVKRRSADGSVGSPHARVGNCQASISEEAHPDGWAFLRLRERKARCRMAAKMPYPAYKCPTFNVFNPFVCPLYLQLLLNRDLANEKCDVNH
uniref:hypothetical protein n=1 Tax=Kluyvera ascorbata TaxID=51288 RepID=UPI0035675EB1